MTARRKFLSIGECMIEMAPNDDGARTMGFAGDTLNTAWYARACLPGSEWQVDYFTRLGTDGFSDRIIGFLSDNGIGTEWIGRDTARHPGLYLIELDDGERHFTYWRENSAARSLADDEAPLEQAIAAADIVYLSGITLAILAPDRRDRLLAVLTHARSRGQTTVFDPNIRATLWESRETMCDTITRAAGAATVVLPSFDDEHSAFGDETVEHCARRYVEAGARDVIVKNGAEPIAFVTADASGVFDDFTAVDPLDTTGAGDAFNGAFLASRAAGSSVVEAIGKAQALAARVVGHRGALMPHGQITALS